MKKKYFTIITIVSFLLYSCSPTFTIRNKTSQTQQLYLSIYNSKRINHIDERLRSDREKDIQKIDSSGTAVKYIINVHPNTSLKAMNHMLWTVINESNMAGKEDVKILITKNNSSDTLFLRHDHKNKINNFRRHLGWNLYYDIY